MLVEEQQLVINLHHYCIICKNASKTTAGGTSVIITDLVAVSATNVYIPQASNWSPDASVGVFALQCCSYCDCNLSTHALIHFATMPTMLLLNKDSEVWTTFTLVKSMEISITAVETAC